MGESTFTKEEIQNQIRNYLQQIETLLQMAHSNYTINLDLVSDSIMNLFPAAFGSLLSDYTGSHILGRAVKSAIRTSQLQQQKQQKMKYSNKLAKHQQILLIIYVFIQVLFDIIIRIICDKRCIFARSI